MLENSKITAAKIWTSEILNLPKFWHVGLSDSHGPASILQDSRHPSNTHGIIVVFCKPRSYEGYERCSEECSDPSFKVKRNIRQIHTQATGNDWWVSLTARQQGCCPSFFKEIWSWDEGKFSNNVESEVSGRGSAETNKWQDERSPSEKLACEVLHLSSAGGRWRANYINM